MKTSKKNNNSFADFYYNIFETYDIKSGNGSFSASSVNIGAAQKIVTTDCLEFSVGADAGLNYYQQDNEITSIGLDKERNEITFKKLNNLLNCIFYFSFNFFCDWLSF